MSKRLVADVGGTNTRIALYDSQEDEIRCLKTYINRDFERFEQVIEAWLGTLAEPAPDEGCLAVAAAPAADKITMFNMNWSFSCSQLAKRFGFKQFAWINDFVAIANAVPFIKPENLRTLYPGESESAGKCAAVGPGTGLGGATVESFGETIQVTACEPGHMGLSPNSPLELELFEYLLRDHPLVYAELLISGPGLQRLYETVCRLHQVSVDTLTPQEISLHALNRSNEECITSLEIFCAQLGSACGDFILANGAYGGLYLAGGIVPKMTEFLQTSDFHHRFCNKAGMQQHMQAVPIHVITHEQPGLLGAAHAQI